MNHIDLGTIQAISVKKQHDENCLLPIAELIQPVKLSILLIATEAPTTTDHQHSAI